MLGITLSATLEWGPLGCNCGGSGGNLYCAILGWGVLGCDYLGMWDPGEIYDVPLWAPNLEIYCSGGF